MFSYIVNLHSYLLSFTKKAQPLVDVDTRQREVALDFDKKWEASEIPGWEDTSDSKLQKNGDGTTCIWCASCKDTFLLPQPRALMQLYL